MKVRLITTKNKRAKQAVYIVLVDDADAAMYDRFSWNLMFKKNGKVEAVRRTVSNGAILLHRSLMSLVPGDGVQVDHINRNPLDNRRANLRVCTSRQNSYNVAKTRLSQLPRGVNRQISGRFVAVISVDHKNYCLGTYDTPEEASAAYQSKASELHGEFAFKG